MKQLIRSAALAALAGVALTLAPAAAAPGLAAVAAAASPEARPAVQLTAHRTRAARFYTVRRGDTLAAVSRREFGTTRAWPAVWWENRHAVRNPQMIRVGQRLYISRWHRVKAWLSARALAAIPRPKPAPRPHAATVAAPAPAAAPAAPAPAPAAPAAPASYSAAPGSFESCVIARESGGDASAVNPSSGAGGLYGFLPSTWAALGYSGLPENASAATQHQAFEREYAQAGTAPWAPFDGC